MRQIVGLGLVVSLIGLMAYFGSKMVIEHGSKFNGQECGGVGGIKCPWGYECVDSEGKTISFGNTGSCRFLLGF